MQSNTANPALSKVSSMHFSLRYLLLGVCIIICFKSQSQQVAVLQGLVLDSLNRPAKNLMVVDDITRNFVRTNDSGFYRIAVGAERYNTLVFRTDDLSFIQTQKVKPLDVDKIYRLDVQLQPLGVGGDTMTEFKFKSQKEREKLS